MEPQTGSRTVCNRTSRGRAPVLCTHTRLERLEEVAMQALQTATNITFKNILFLTDFSEASQAALAYAMGLSRHFKAHLFPAHASDPVVLTETVNPDIVDEIIEHSQN